MGDFDDGFHTVSCTWFTHYCQWLEYSAFKISEAFASELLGNLEEMFLGHNVHWYV